MLADTLDLTRDCHTAYLEADNSTRRLFNRAFFAKIYIDEDDETREQTVRVDYNEPFDSLLSRIIPASVHRNFDIKKTAFGEIQIGGYEADTRRTDKVQGSHKDTLVEVMRGLYNLVHPAQSLIMSWKPSDDKRKNKKQPLNLNNCDYSSQIKEFIPKQVQH